MVVRNYIEDINRFRLSGPPQWFLRQLAEFDDSLVIVPSRQGFFYRLAQRRKLQLPEKIVNDVLREQADTAMLASYGLVPVTTVLATANWSNPYIFEDLRRRAPWRMGGADKYNEMVMAQDRQDRMETNMKTAEMVDHLAKDSWLYYNKLIGTRSHAFKVRTEKPKSEGNKAPSIIVSNRPAYSPQLDTAWGNVLKPRKRR